NDVAVRVEHRVLRRVVCFVVQPNPHCLLSLFDVRPLLVCISTPFLRELLGHLLGVNFTQRLAVNVFQYPLSRPRQLPLLNLCCLDFHLRRILKVLAVLIRVHDAVSQCDVIVPRVLWGRRRQNSGCLLRGVPVLLGHLLRHFVRSVIPSTSELTHWLRHRIVQRHEIVCHVIDKFIITFLGTLEVFVRKSNARIFCDGACQLLRIPKLPTPAGVGLGRGFYSSHICVLSGSVRHISFR